MVATLGRDGDGWVSMVEQAVKMCGASRVSTEADSGSWSVVDVEAGLPCEAVGRGSLEERRCRIKGISHFGSRGSSVDC